METTNTNAALDSISIPQLQERYSLSTRQAVYNRLDKLGIKPEKGKINSEQLARMDQQHLELQDPNKGATLAPMSSMSTGQTKKSSGQLDNQLTLQPEIMLAMFEMLAARPQQQQPEPSAIASLRERLELLELCAQQGNTLSTSELSEVLGIKPDSLRDRKRHSQYGYSLSRAGKHSHELAWKIEKSYP